MPLPIARPRVWLLATSSEFDDAPRESRVERAPVAAPAPAPHAKVFTPGVTIVGSRRSRTFSKVAELAKILTSPAWPAAVRGPAHAEAMVVARDALKGTIPPDKARAAFIAAAVEAGIDVTA